MKSFHFSIFLIILCGLVIWQATLIPKSGLVDSVGAKNFPYFIVLAVWILFSVILGLQLGPFFKFLS
ncbi:MAG: hypothetical protein EB044_04800 [Actinobacteria bacterium]|nr:hypothetical protein [Actinomycetota bacterium]